MAKKKDPTRIIEDTFRFLFGMMKMTNAESLTLSCTSKEKDVTLTVRKTETLHNPEYDCNTISLKLNAGDDEKGLDLSEFKKASEKNRE